MAPHPLTNFELRIDIKTNVNLIVFIQETIYLRQRITNM